MKTPRTSELRVRHAMGNARVGHVFSLAEELERENAALRVELLKATGSLGLITAGANPKAEGHKANLESARKALCATATPDELVCPTCKSARWAEIHPSNSDPTGYTLYCRRCEEGCVSPARAALAAGGAK